MPPCISLQDLGNRTCLTNHPIGADFLKWGISCCGLWEERGDGGQQADLFPLGWGYTWWSTEWGGELWSHLQPLPCLHTVAERGKKCTPSIPSHHHTGWQGNWHPAPIPADFPLPGARAHTLIEHITTICSGMGMWHVVQTISFDEEIFVYLLSSFLIGLLLGRTGRDWNIHHFWYHKPAGTKVGIWETDQEHTKTAQHYKTASL